MQFENDYRQLSPAEVEQLKQQGCMADDWAAVWVRGLFRPERIQGVSFLGTVHLGDMSGSVHATSASHDMGQLPSTIIRATLRNVDIADWFYIQDVALIDGYEVGGRFVAVNCGRIVAGEGSFGIGSRVSVVNEGGGREVALSASLTSNIAYIVAMHRYIPGLVEGYERLVRAEAEALKPQIAKDVHIFSTRLVENVRIGRRAIIDGASALRHGTILSHPDQPTTVGSDVDADYFVFAEGALVDSAAKIRNSFVGQCVTVAQGFNAQDTLAFANSQLLCGEAVAVLAGPFTVSHHKSSLLIAGAYSFFNAGSSTNGSNHQYRLGPIEQAVFDRGVKTGSGSYLLYPAHIGPFTMVVGHHKTNPDTSAYPFSVLAEKEGESHLIVAQNLRTMGLFRDWRKWRSRDKRTLKSDQISYDILNPITVRQMMDAVRRIEGQMVESKSTHLIEGGLRIKRALLPRAAVAYRQAIDLYLAKAYAHDAGQSESLHCDWADVGGLVAPIDEVRTIESRIVAEAYNSVEQIAADFAALADKVPTLATRWAVGQARLWYSYNDSEDDFKDAIQRLAEACHNIKEATLADATREWAAKMKVSYGADAELHDPDADFAAIRGEFDSHPDVRDLHKYYDEMG